MIDKIRQRLRKQFREPSYRRAYVDSFLNTAIAAQIKALRETRGMSQKELGSRINTQQSGISALENVNYSRWSLSTLRKLAEAFDVALVVKFVSFGEVLDEIASFNPSTLNKPTFDDDPAFQVDDPPPVNARAFANVTNLDAYRQQQTSTSLASSSKVTQLRAVVS